MKIQRNLPLLLLFLLSIVSILAIITISLFTSVVYAQENQTEEEKNQIPEAAKGPVIPSKGYLVEEIRDGLFWVTDGAYNTIFLVTDKGIVAVDAPPTIGKNYLKAISEVTDKPITHVIYSHAHIDHIGAAGMFPKNAVIIAQEETAAELQRAKTISTNASMVLPIPTETFSNNYTLQIGNQTLQLDYYGNNHSPGNIFIYAPKQKVLMLVDVVFPGWAPFPYLATAKDVAGFIKSHDIALNNYDFNTFVGGHLTRLGTINDVILQREFVSDLERAAAQANQQVSFGEITKQLGGGQQLLFSLWRKELMQLVKTVQITCYLNGKIGLAERSSSCQPIAIPWLRLEG
jgi:glyoxylase-like metal-dependent hydrolase (beta-lactamase superfamily II)